MKKNLLALFLVGMSVFVNGAANERKDGTAKIEKDSYCTVPGEYGEFKKINDKDYKVEINFESCVFDGETLNNPKVGILVQDTEKVKNYIKKYKFVHFQEGKNLTYNSKENSFMYNGGWYWDNSKAYPKAIFDAKKVDTNKKDSGK